MSKKPTKKPRKSINGSLKKAAPEVMTVKQAAEYLQLNIQVLYRYIRGGSVPVSKVGNSLRFQKSVLDEWLRTQALGNVDGKDIPSAQGEPVRGELNMEED